MPKLLDITRLGNPTLRAQCSEIDPSEIVGGHVQSLILDMQYTLAQKELGVGLAAPQVGESIMLSVIGIKPTPTRPELVPFNTVLINPSIIKTHGTARPKWEGCVSCGTGDDILYAQVPRYDAVTLRWLDEAAVQHEERLDGFVAHVVQHEVDHLNGILFVDHVEDTASYMLADEYKRRIVHADKP